MSATATPTTKATTMTAHRAELNGLRSPFIELAGDRWIHLPRPKLLRLRRVLRLTEQPLIWPESMQAGPHAHTHTHAHAHWHTVRLSISAFMSKLRERRHSKWNWG